MKIIIVLSVILVFGVSFSNCKRYDGYKLFRVFFEKDEQEHLRALVDNIPGAEFWLFSIARGSADVFTSPEAEYEFVTSLANNGFASSVLETDVQGLIDGTKDILTL